MHSICYFIPIMQHDQYTSDQYTSVQYHFTSVYYHYTSVLLTSVWVVELSTYNTSIVIVPVLVTDCAPLPVHADFNPSLQLV